MTRNELITEALAWVGTPWMHQACVKGVATDCIGLIAGVARECGSAEARRFLSTPECRNYSREPDVKKLRAACIEFLDPKPLTYAREGDVLVLSFLRDPMHFAFVAPQGRIIHAYASFGVVHHRYDETWRARTLEAYSLRGVV